MFASHTKPCKSSAVEAALHTSCAIFHVLGGCITEGSVQDVFVLNWFQFDSSMTVRIWIWLGGGVFEVGGRGCEVDPDILVHNMLYEYHENNGFNSMSMRLRYGLGRLSY